MLQTSLIYYLRTILNVEYLRTADPAIGSVNCCTGRKIQQPSGEMISIAISEDSGEKQEFDDFDTKCITYENA